MKIFDKMANIAIFGLVFVVGGALIPEVYFSYFDNTQYFTVNYVDLNKESYKPGDIVEVKVNRTSLVNEDGTSIRELVLLKLDDKNNQEFNEVYTERLDIAISKGTETLILNYKLPAPLTGGEYFWRATIVFEVRNQKKVVSFTTPTFDVKNGQSENANANNQGIGHAVQ